MPDWAADVRRRLSSVRLSPERESEMVEELSQHLEDRWHNLVSGGAEPDVAAQLAIAEFRDSDLLAKQLAPLRQAGWTDPSPPAPGGWPSLQGLLFDLRKVMRALCAVPGFTVVALLVVTLSIGATTAI